MCIRALNWSRPVARFKKKRLCIKQRQRKREFRLLDGSQHGCWVQNIQVRWSVNLYVTECWKTHGQWMETLNVYKRSDCLQLCSLSPIYPSVCAYVCVGNVLVRRTSHTTCRKGNYSRPLRSTCHQLSHFTPTTFSWVTFTLIWHSLGSVPYNMNFKDTTYWAIKICDFQYYCLGQSKERRKKNFWLLFFRSVKKPLYLVFLLKFILTSC